MQPVEVTTRSASIAFVYFTVLGLTQCILASLWSNLYGAFIGFAGLILGCVYGCFLAAKICEKRKGYYNVEQGIAIRYYKEFNFAFVMTRTIQTIRRVQFLQILLGIYLFLLILVRASSPDADVEQFPSSCEDKYQGCARVALSNPHRDSGLAPALIHSNLNLVKQVVRKWIEDQPREDIIGEYSYFDNSDGSSNEEENNTEQNVLFHARFVSLFWGFADDLFVSLGCGEDGAVVVQAQSQLRLGEGDFGVNKIRVKEFITWMQIFQQNGTMASGSCGRVQ